MTVRIGSYVLGRCIGRGGNAAVHAARHETTLGTARVVALKILSRAFDGGAPSAHAPGASFESFRREALLATRLEHPGIIRTYDIGEHEGQLYLAMELVLGATLARARGEAPLPMFRRIVGDIARALEYVHALKDETGTVLGIVHQDVSPQNVMVGYDGRVRLLDFGVARLASVDASRTDTVRGKPAYLSPEQLEGENIDPRTDIFALGALAYELLTGKVLFARDTIAATYRAVLLEPIPDLATARPDAPVEVLAVVTKALRRDPSARWQTAGELATALDRACDAASVKRADDAVMAVWVTHVAPPEHAPGDLFEDEAGGHLALAQREEPAPTLAAPIHEEGPFYEERAPLPADAEDDDRLPVRRVGRPVLAVLAGIAAIVGALALRSSCDSSHAGEAGANAPRASAMAPREIGDGAAAAAQNTMEDAGPPSPLSATAATSATLATVPSGRGRLKLRGAGAASRGETTTDTENIAAATPAASASATAAPAVASGGFLSVWSNVWGHVDVDGRAVGDSPVTHLPLPPGSHQLHVRTDRGEQMRTVVIEPAHEERARFVF